MFSISILNGAFSHAIFNSLISFILRFALHSGHCCCAWAEFGTLIEFIIHFISEIEERKELKLVRIGIS